MNRSITAPQRYRGTETFAVKVIKILLGYEGWEPNGSIKILKKFSGFYPRTSFTARTILTLVTLVDVAHVSTECLMSLTFADVDHTYA